MPYYVKINWLETKYSEPDLPPEQAQRAAILQARLAVILMNGRITQFQNQQVSNRKLLVLENGLLKQRVTSEGIPVIIKSGNLVTLAETEYIVN